MQRVCSQRGGFEMAKEKPSNKELSKVLDIPEDIVAQIQDTGGYISTGVAAQLLCINPQTLRDWGEREELVPDRILASGHRRYLLTTIADYIKKERVKE